MKRINITLILLLAMVQYSCESSEKGSQGENFDSHVNRVAATIIDNSDQLAFFDEPQKPLEPTLQLLPGGSVTPRGWILEVMEQDLHSGVVGALETLYPGIKADDLYNTARRGGMEDIPEMGDLVLTGADWEKSIMWWNAETIGNWWDGFIRHAFFTQDQEAMAKSEAIVNNLLASQDEDGYIGIYKPNLRYQHSGSNGELWAQTTAFRSLLAYYEFTENKAVLEAVEKAMAVTMTKYGPNGRNPFFLENAFGGVTHGLMLTDVCETLHRITGYQEYQDYATYLYRAFSTYSINRSFNDLRYPFLIEKDSLFEGHGVHTYEHLRTMVNAYYNTGYPELATAYDNMLAKLDRCILPTGAGHGNEWIAKLDADPDHTATEFCTMLELRNSYGSLLQKTGDVSFADAAEKLTFNAMFGFRNEDGTAITYSKPDNCYLLDGKHREDGEAKPEPRFKYSPTHSEPAVCCVPNYGRNMPYFLDNMWMKKGNGLAAVLYGPNKLTTVLNGVDITIEEKTSYPVSDEIKLLVETSEPVAFDLYLRKPNWAGDMTVSGAEVSDEKDGFFRITKEWQEDEILISFSNPVEKVPFNKEYYVQRGPLVYSLPIPYRKELIKAYELEGFADYHCFPTSDQYMYLSLQNENNFRFQAARTETFPAHGEDTYIETEMLNSNANTKETVKLIPVGNTVLRRVTFPKN